MTIKELAQVQAAGIDIKVVESDAEGKVTEKAKDIYAEVKENAEDLEDKTEDAIDTLKQKFQEKKDSKEA